MHHLRAGAKGGFFSFFRHTLPLFHRNSQKKSVHAEGQILLFPLLPGSTSHPLLFCIAATNVRMDRLCRDYSVMEYTGRVLRGWFQRACGAGWQDQKNGKRGSETEQRNACGGKWCFLFPFPFPKKNGKSSGIWKNGWKRGGESLAPPQLYIVYNVSNLAVLLLPIVYSWTIYFRQKHTRCDCHHFFCSLGGGCNNQLDPILWVNNNGT